MRGPAGSGASPSAWGFFFQIAVLASLFHHISGKPPFMPVGFPGDPSALLGPPRPEEGPWGVIGSPLELSATSGSWDIHHSFSRSVFLSFICRERGRETYVRIFICVSMGKQPNTYTYTYICYMYKCMLVAFGCCPNVHAPHQQPQIPSVLATLDACPKAILLE